MREVKNNGQPTPLNAPILKRRTACDGEFNTYAGERDDTALFVLYKNRRLDGGGNRMKKTIARETREQFNFIKHELKRGNENIMPYLSGTMKKRTMMYKETYRYEENAKIDYELGVIGKNEYEIEMKAVRLLEKALANFKVF